MSVWRRTSCTFAPRRMMNCAGVAHRTRAEGERRHYATAADSRPTSRVETVRSDHEPELTARCGSWARGSPSAPVSLTRSPRSTIP